jgi:threonine/homoserine/homoserine lactone efflux protein
VLTALLYFLLSAAISYVASLQLGPVNLRVIQCTVQFNKSYALRVGIGGSVPEIFYTALAFVIIEQIDPAQFSHNWMHAVTIPLFLLLAFINLRKKFIPKNIDTQSTPTHRRGFWEGFVLAALNPQLITFWLLIIAFLKTKDILVSGTLLQQGAFVLGSAAGAFVLQLTFIAVAGRYKDWIVKKAGKSFNKLIGGLFLLLALADITKLLITNL